jgi:RNA polymerase sigma-70 factor, ECF subfamily
MTDPGPAEDLELLAALRAGDEAAFAALVDRLYGVMLHLAVVHVGSRSVAEEVVQDAWLAVLGQLDRFEGRSSLRTWVLRILSNLAKTRGARERRTVPLSALDGTDQAEPAVDPDRFLGPGHRWAGHWAVPPASWQELPEARVLAGEAVAQVQAAIEALPAGQRAVITLRDVHGWTAPEVCGALGLSEGNQRVLLHRARARVRRALERYLDEPAEAVRG